MKKILYLLSALVLSASCAGETKSVITKTPQDNIVEKVYLDNHSTTIFTVNIEGHTYIVHKGLHGEAIIHAEHCDCKTN